MGFDNDPVGNGFAASLARPGANMTGLSSLAPEITGKQLEFLKEIVPRLSRVAVLGNAREPANQQLFTDAEIAAGTFRVRLQYIDIPTPKDIETAFRTATTGRADAIVMFGAFIFNPHRGEIAKLSV